jgi:hypothetical protein
MHKLPVFLFIYANKNGNIFNMDYNGQWNSIYAHYTTFGKEK